MRVLSVYIEIKGCQVYVGEICGNTPEDARFSYAESYMENPETVPVSLSLPFSDGAFSPVQTKNFFEGLLPEGFTRRCVAEWMHVNENDYLSILSGLGCECLGALRITEGENPQVLPDYKKLSFAEVRNLAKEGASESAQQLCLLTASYLGIDTPDSFVVDTGNAEDGDVLLATKRYDRMNDSSKERFIHHLPVPLRLHQEDFAQTLGYEHLQLSDWKYR